MKAGNMQNIFDLADSFGPGRVIHIHRASIGLKAIVVWFPRDQVAFVNGGMIMLGSLGTAWGAVMAFWFGSTHGSAEKTRLLAASPPTK